MISGQVIDWRTSRPVPYVDVLAEGLNSANVVARTGADGRFRFQPEASPGVYFLFVAAPRYGLLLQAKVGQTAVMYRKSQRIHDLIIPAIPATEISGHVYQDDGSPISGCLVYAFTRASHLGLSINLQAEGVRSILPFDQAEADDPNKFLEGGMVRTNPRGMYVFPNMGADRYFISVRCEASPAQQRAGVNWVPALYPDVASIADAQQVLLMPGDHRADIDFHIPRAKAYTLEGTVLFSDLSKPKPWPEATYFQDLVVFRSDRRLTSTSFGREPCQIDINKGTFKCDPLLSGEYTLYFQVSGGMGSASNQPTQAATVRYRVTAGRTQPLKVQLHSVSGENAVYQSPFQGPGGLIDFTKVCDAVPQGMPAVRAVAWGSGYAGVNCYLTRVGSPTSVRLPQGSYQVAAFEADILHRPFGRGSSFEEALVQSGTRITVSTGRTETPALRVLTTAQIIEIGLSSLRAEPR